MHILIEEYPYNAADVKETLDGLDALQNVEHKVSLSYVGYYYNAKINDCVFILPKVLIDDKSKVLGKYSPESLINVNSDNCEIDEADRKFLHEFAVWIYRSFVVFKQSNPQSGIIYNKEILEVTRSRKRRIGTLLDVILSLVRFSYEHRDFITFILKNIHAGNNKINWTRTVIRSKTLIQSNEAIYLNPVNRKRQINFDEELLIIFYSILHYICQEYGFRIETTPGFELIKGRKFESYLSGKGKLRLKQIKYKYYSDLAIELWELCYAFFERSKEISVSKAQNEYLLVKNFHIVFESIIDELVGSNEDKKRLPSELSDQKDGKLVDHLYTYKGLIETEDENTQTYYIGDSKYYSIGHDIGEHSIYKQYTYARNIIQYNIDLWRKKLDENHPVRVRDEQTEGYNVLPNFFISASLDNKEGKLDLTYKSRDLTPTGEPQLSFQFENRLFDRDTLLLSRYNVNFLFVIALYARNNKSEKTIWKNEVREQFRNEIQEMLNGRYEFFALKSKGNVIEGEQFINENFKALQGRLFRPFADKDIYALALKKPKGENQANTDSDLYKLLNEAFVISNLKIGESPKEGLEREIEAFQQQHPYQKPNNSLLPQYHVERYLENYFVVGMYHKATAEWSHWDWITGKNDRSSLIYNVRLDKARAGFVPKSKIREMKPKFAILYEEGNQSEYRVFRIHDTAVMTKERMERAGYQNPKSDYFIFRFDEEIAIGKINLQKLISEKQKAEYGTPIYLKGKELLGFRE